MKKTSVDKLPRLTITLGRGQREALEAIAQRNHTTLSFIVRHALARFVEEQKQKQFRVEL
jgi:predicted transcriptional regulator